jgi:hypothetical protein
MEILIVDSVLEFAKSLNDGELNKLIETITNVLKILKENNKLSNLPNIKKYKGHEFYLRCYKRVLEHVKNGTSETCRCKFFNYRCNEYKCIIQ